jgi:hypothetical protein
MMQSQRPLKTGKARYMQIGARVGVSLAVLAELVIGVYFGFIAAILAALAVPFVGEMMDCLALFVAILLAVIGFYIGMLGGLIVWGIQAASDH